MAYTEQQKYVTGIISLWLLLPVIVYICENCMNFVNYENCFAFFIIIVSIISTLMWKYYGKITILYFCDLFCAKILFILLCYFYNYKSSYKHNYYFKFLFPIGVLFTYLLGWLFFKYSPNISIFSHLLMRLIGFWWVCFTIISPTSYILEPISIFSLFVASCTFILYIFNSTNTINFSCFENYNKGCCFTILYIITTMLIYFSAYFIVKYAIRI